MPRFFVEQVTGEQAFVQGQDAWHLCKVLRVRPGEEVVLCDSEGMEYRGELVRADEALAEIKVLEKRPCAAEPTVHFTLYQCLPKGDKLEFIVQKAVELGACEIVPVLSQRCVSRPDGRAMEKRRERCQRVAEEAAKQSGRGRIPQVRPLIRFEQAIQELSDMPCGILFYEQATAPLHGALQNTPNKIGLLIGPEGGFAPEEAQLAQNSGLMLLSLGSRILRCETAPLCALSILLYETGNI